MNSYMIKKDVQEFESFIKRLSNDIKHSSSLWNDSKYKELFLSVGEIANESKDLIIAGDRLCSMIEQFERIAKEEY